MPTPGREVQAEWPGTSEPTASDAMRVEGGETS